MKFVFPIAFANEVILKMSTQGRRLQANLAFIFGECLVLLIFLRFLFVSKLSLCMCLCVGLYT